MLHRWSSVLLLVGTACSPRPAEPARSAHGPVVATTVPAPPEPVPEEPLAEAPAPACTKISGAPETVVAARGATVYAVDDKAVYWSDGRTLSTASLDGSGVRALSLAATAKSDIVGLEARDGELWIALTRWEKGKCRGELVVMTVSDEKTRRLEPARCARDIALDAERVHWTEETAFPDPGGLATNVYSAPRKGGASVARLDMLNGISFLVSDGAHVYFTDDVGGKLRRMPVAHGEPTQLLEARRVDESFNSLDSDSLAVDATHLYFLHGHHNFEVGMRVFRVPKDGGSPEKLADAYPGEMHGQGLMQGPLALGAAHVYWVASREGEVRRVDKAGKCGVEVVASKRSAPNRVRVSNGALYWLETGAEPRSIARLRELR